LFKKHQNDLHKLAANQTNLELILEKTTNRIDIDINLLKEKIFAIAEVPNSIKPQKDFVDSVYKLLDASVDN